MKVNIALSIPKEYNPERFAPLFRQIEQQVNGAYEGRVTCRFTAEAAPTTGTWARGDIVYDATPSSGGHVGWICTAGGTPGTWKTWGAIS